jgi:hypothetical protein
MELELGNGIFAINRWTKVVVDVIGEMDAQEFDSTKFGNMEVRIYSRINDFSFFKSLNSCIYF